MIVLVVVAFWAVRRGYVKSGMGEKLVREEKYDFGEVSCSWVVVVVATLTRFCGGDTNGYFWRLMAIIDDFVCNNCFVGDKTKARVVGGRRSNEAVDWSIVAACRNLIQRELCGVGMGVADLKERSVETPRSFLARCFFGFCEFAPVGIVSLWQRHSPPGSVWWLRLVSTQIITNESLKQKALVVIATYFMLASERVNARVRNIIAPNYKYHEVVDQ